MDMDKNGRLHIVLNGIVCNHDQECQSLCVILRILFPNTSLSTSDLSIQFRNYYLTLLLKGQCTLSFGLSSGLGLGRRHVLEGAMEFLDPTFLSCINTSLQRGNIGDLLASGHLKIPDCLLNQTVELGLLLDERFQTLYGWPLEECCGREEITSNNERHLYHERFNSGYLQSLRVSSSSNALSRLAPFSRIAE